jgi:hypothetical protein
MNNNNNESHHKRIILQQSFAKNENFCFKTNTLMREKLCVNNEYNEYLYNVRIFFLLYNELLYI